jgi:hypothetical protein
MVFFGFGLWTTWLSKIWPGLLNPFTLIQVTKSADWPDLCQFRWWSADLCFLFYSILANFKLLVYLLNFSELWGKPRSVCFILHWFCVEKTSAEVKTLFWITELYRVPGFLSSRPNWLRRPLAPLQASEISPLWFRGGHTWRGDGGSRFGPREGHSGTLGIVLYVLNAS